VQKHEQQHYFNNFASMLMVIIEIMLSQNLETQIMTS